MIDDDKLRMLVKHAAPNSVSVWMPVHRAGADIRQNPIRLKNLLIDAREQLTALGVREPEARRQLKPLRALVDDEDFWRHQAEGLGVFLGDSRPEGVRLPLPAPQTVTVSEHYYLMPLFAALRRNERFYLLQLSQHTVRLFRADRTDLEPVDLPNAPESFEQFLQLDEQEGHVGFHSGMAEHKPGAERPAVFHGQGTGADETWQKRRLADFCRQIDANVRKVLYNEKSPLLLAATEPIRATYRQVSGCRQLDRRAVEGNPDDASPSALHRQAASLLRDDFDRPLREATDRYHQAKGAGLTTNDLQGALRAASVSAVEALFVPHDRRVWGRFDADAGTLDRHHAQQPGDEDLLNLTAVLAARGGANVLAVAPRDVPEGDGDPEPLAAVLRFRPDAA